MNAEIIQEFKAYINGVQFNEEKSYYLIKDFLTKFEDKFGEIYNFDFVEELAYIFLMNPEDEYDIMHKSLLEDLEKANHFYEFQISIIGSDEDTQDFIKSMNKHFDNYNYYKTYSLFMKDRYNVDW
jgi:hypothetical protein